MPAAVPIAVAAAVGSALAASRVKKSRRDGLAVTMHTLPWRGERRVRVVHLTDIHVGISTPKRVLDRVADIVRSLEHDVVVLTGDYVNMSTFYAKRITDFVSALPKPCVATLGNHDHWASASRITRALEAGGACVLRNQSVVAAGLVIVGVDDGHTGNADVDRAFSDVDERDRDRALVLSHFPNTADAIAKKGARLVLSGHTHAGQVDVPRVMPFLARLAGNPYLRGFHRIGAKTDLYVNAGIGHSLAGLRGGRTAPEIAVFDLDPRARARKSVVLRAAWRKREA
jgi:predicted MPP superfamily phosphohydrolase